MLIDHPIDPSLLSIYTNIADTAITCNNTCPTILVFLFIENISIAQIYIIPQLVIAAHGISGVVSLLIKTNTKANIIDEAIKIFNNFSVFLLFNFSGYII